ncbi:hypothetical protein RHMOL_Rhmol10G0194900 [Rhododendron molle]|uniref:Uncharacterized protein n=1 Tax=Rhododendron molle TaxID=49168 RepID=A0ACC0M572_RHOML|nr:hypothetical protein RHMOL_Rhmol10G0194900 [Rhododendron molle]
MGGSSPSIDPIFDPLVGLDFEIESNFIDNHMMAEEKKDSVMDIVCWKPCEEIQNEKLVGILNTKLMRVEKKRRKKANKSSGDAMEDDEDYDFKVDYVKKGSDMDDGEENEEAGGSNQTRFEVLASGVEIDE